MNVDRSWKVEWIGQVTIAVEDLEKAREFWGDLLNAPFSEPTNVEGEDTFKQFDIRASALMPSQRGAISLTAPLNPDGAFSRDLKRRGPGLRVVSLVVDDFDQALAHIKSRGVRLIGTEDMPDWKSAVFHPKDTYGVTLEIMWKKSPWVDRDKRA